MSRQDNVFSKEENEAIKQEVDAHGSRWANILKEHMISYVVSQISQLLLKRLMNYMVSSRQYFVKIWRPSFKLG